MTTDSSDYLQGLKPVRIHFETKKDQIDGFYLLMTSGKPVHGLDNGQYIISHSQCLKFNPNKIRVEILLPLSYNDGKPIEKSKFANTEGELAQHFGGCTTLIPVEGLWIDDDLKEYADINSGFYVVAPLNKESIRFFEEYIKKLKKRFKQKHILITFLPIRRILL